VISSHPPPQKLASLTNKGKCLLGFLKVLAAFRTYVWSGQAWAIFESCLSCKCFESFCWVEP